MKKKIISLLILVTMLPAYFNCSAKEIQGAEGEALLEIHKNFEEDTDKENFDLVTGGYEISNQGNGTKGVFVYNSPRSTGTGTLNLKQNINEGVLEVSFDYKNSGWTNRFYIRMFSGTSGAVAETFNDYGTFGYFAKGLGWTPADHRVSYVTNKWYRVSMFINMDTRMIYYYIDGKLYGYTPVKEDFTDIRRFEFIYHGSYDKTMIDNLCAKAYVGDDMALPEEVRWSAFTDTTTKNNGRIFFEKEKQNLIVTVGNKTGEAKDFDLKCTVLNSGRIVNETTQELHLEDGEVRDIEYEGSTDGYGYYTLLPQLYDKEGNLIFAGREYEYSVANVPPEGLKDESMGIQMQSSVEINRNDVENVDLPLISRLGFGATRGGLGWSRNTHKAVGVWELDSWNEYVEEKYIENGIERIPILAFGNAAITNENPPRSEWALEQFAWNAVRVCEFYEKKQGYPLKNIDIWNEYWMGGSGFNQDNATPEDYANMLKVTYTAIKEKYPTTTVWGLSGVNRDHLEWTERVLKAGGGDYMDGYTLHPYYNKGTPDAADFVGLKKAYDDLFAKYGYTDKLCWVSEWGWPSCDVDGYPDERHQAAYFIEANVINTANDLFDMTNWYSSNNVNNDNGQESRFGLLRGAYDYVGYGAKPAYLSVANYMNMMIGAEHIENHHISDNITLYRYKLRDGKDALIGWAKEFDEATAIHLNTDSVIVYDMYGNPQQLNGVNNEFSFMFSDMPVYITGRFDKVEKRTQAVEMEETAVEMVRGDKTEFTIKKLFNEDAEVQLDLPGGVKIVSNNGFVDNKCTIVLESEVTDKEEDTIPVKIIVNGKTVFCYDLHVVYIQPIDFSISTRPYSAKQVDRWQAIIKVKGNFYDERVEGKLHITSPAEMATGDKPIKINKVGPGEERIIKVNIPKSISKDAFTFKATLEMEGYETLEIDHTVNLRCSTFVKTAPVIDGKIDKGEWDVRTVMLMNNRDSFVKIGKSVVFGGKSDLSAKIYTGWDYENFYLAAEVTDNEWAWHDSLLWSSDGIQFAMAPSKEGTQLAQIDIGSINGEEQVLMELSTNAANIGPVEDADFKMGREGNVTIYELKISWKDIFPDGYILRKNSSVPFSMLINDNDGTGRRGYMENGGGLGSGIKNVYEFLDLFLLF